MRLSTTSSSRATLRPSPVSLAPNTHALLHTHIVTPHSHDEMCGVCKARASHPATQPPSHPARESATDFRHSVSVDRNNAPFPPPFPRHFSGCGGARRYCTVRLGLWPGAGAVYESADNESWFISGCRRFVNWAQTEQQHPDTARKVVHRALPRSIHGILDSPGSLSFSHINFRANAGKLEYVTNRRTVDSMGYYAPFLPAHKSLSPRAPAEYCFG